MEKLALWSFLWVLCLGVGFLGKMLLWLLHTLLMANTNIYLVFDI